jgi:putative flippase GtrA
MSAFFTPALVRFLKYSAIGVSTLSFDLLLVAAMTELLSLPYYVSVPLGFLVAVSINYALSRTLVFKGTQRPVHHGYAYFVALALLGAAAITGAVSLMVTYLMMQYLVARVLVAGFVGLANYLLNLHLNFKVAGIH